MLEEDDLIIYVEKANGVKCERCWKYCNDIGESKEHPTICQNCIDAL